MVSIHTNYVVARDEQISRVMRETEYDAGLVRRFNAGDRSAFDEIVARHRDKLFLISLGFLKDRSDAEEMAQDALVRAHRGLASFRGDSSLATWLYRIVVNLSRNRFAFLMRRRCDRKVSLDAPLGEAGSLTFADAMASDTRNSLQEIALNEFTEIVARSMKLLTPAHREILTLRIVMECSYEDIASILGIEVGTVKSRIARARVELFARMIQICPELSTRAHVSDFLIGDWQPDGLVHLA